MRAGSPDSCGRLGVDAAHNATQAQAITHLYGWHLAGEVTIGDLDGGLELARRGQCVAIRQTCFDTAPQLRAQTRVEC